ncbi:DUF2330 domain-containing protein [Plectonema cf. radiosum LEGE 06105]|uniref:DUF2330 domain-containing protein n=1 Tax=Plectonema cf. radiosum LEGE 06105 TaxID=945769 RepID=A0A8J7F0E4_9CYAN|nr:DUF2330 domain-containing protein [Plectonema radiosum]MBE9212190.1 DUF2330 domain-containing protein [Plectonema cf. radiosum LEGE 06105]
MKFQRLLISVLLAFVIAICFTPSALAFCGFYVAKADSKLYNKASQVVIARKDNRTVLTMANDYQGDVKDFAMVVPVPTVLKEEQVIVAKPKIIERLDAFSAPRLVEYFDEDPCAPAYEREIQNNLPMSAPAPTTQASKRSDRNLGVTVEAQFNVGEYDIVILSAKESRGLERWLHGNGYKIPRGAKQLLNPYIRQNMKFFVAKVNLEKFDENGYQNLRPLQIAYESSKFMLPIRLGMVNSTSEQDLIAYILSSKGQTELTNYRTVKVPSEVNIPVYVKEEFGNFYKSMFQTSYTKEDKKVAFLEYAWDMGNCDPCSADPLNREELIDAGVFWLDDNSSGIVPPGFRGGFPSSNVFVTRLHVRYTRDKFPEDLMFQETSNRDSFQGRYVLQHPFTGETNCSAARQYQKSLRNRFEKEAQTLAKLTNWNIQDIRQKMKIEGQVSSSFWQTFLSWLGM